MKKFLILIVIVVLWWLGYRYITNNPNTDIAQRINSVIGNKNIDTRNSTVSNEQYIVKTIGRGGNVGEDIYVQDKAGNAVLSLVNGDAQYVYKLLDHYLILDIWTSAGSRTLAIYDLQTKMKIFETNYYGGLSNSLSLKGNIIQFYYTIRYEYQWLENMPSDAPHCAATYNGYIETRTFDITTRQLTKTWKYTCAYFE